MVIRKEDCVSLPTDACGMTIVGVFFSITILSLKPSHCGQGPIAIGLRI